MVGGGLNVRLYRSDDPVHAHVFFVLPWYLNGTLRGPEEARVVDHVARCAVCRREMAALQVLRDAVAAEVRDPGLSGSLQRMHALLEGEHVRNALPLRWLRDQWQSAPTFARMLIAAQTGLLIVLAGLAWVWQPSSAPAYHTLLAPHGLPRSAALLTVVFDENRPEAQIRELLWHVGARIIEGPNTAGAYVLSVPAGRERETLVALRARPEVKFAEPASAPAEPAR
jgi:hypothetical protein